jgi:hypothetical protein
VKLRNVTGFKRGCDNSEESGWFLIRFRRQRRSRLGVDVTGSTMPRVIVYVSQRFLSMVDKLAAESPSSRSTLLGQVLVLGLRSYVDIRREATRLASESRTEVEPIHDSPNPNTDAAPPTLSTIATVRDASSSFVFAGLTLYWRTDRTVRK